MHSELKDFLHNIAKASHLSVLTRGKSIAVRVSYQVRE